MNTNDLVFYDIEVTKFDALVVFMNIDGKDLGHCWNNRDRVDAQNWADLPSGFEPIEDIIRGKTLVGYNNHHYDDYIITCMRSKYESTVQNIKAKNDRIIHGTGAGVDLPDGFVTLDVYQQISTAKPGLKTVEGNLGLSIIESSVNFDVDHPLSDEEREEMLQYCRYDVLSTIKVFKLRLKEYFEVKESLIQMLPEEMRLKAPRWNTTTISANILLYDATIEEWNPDASVHPTQWGSVKAIPEAVGKEWEKYWGKVDGIPSSVWESWEGCMTIDTAKKKGISRTVNTMDCKFVFGLGGLHGAPVKPGTYYKVRLADVGSMYPSIITKLGILGDATGLYDSIRLERLSIKKSDPVRANAMKLVLNSVYGNLKNQFSPLKNYLASNTVCIYGQIALFRLCTMISDAGYTIVNANTDGVAFIDRPELGDAADRIYKAWESEFTGMTLEEDLFDIWYQKDVNNYIAIRPDGKVKTKGGETNKAYTDKPFDNNSIRIVQRAVVECIVNGIDPTITVVEMRDQPLLYQYILKAGSTYLGIKDSTGAWMPQKVNRVFAVSDLSGIEYTTLYKVRQDEGLVCFPDTPDRMKLWNADVNTYTDFKKEIDVEWYTNLAKNKLKGWGF